MSDFKRIYQVSLGHKCLKIIKKVWAGYINWEVVKLEDGM